MSSRADAYTTRELEAARKLLAELKAAYDTLPMRHRAAVREALDEASRTTGCD